MSCSIEAIGLPVIQGCPSYNELFLVFGAVGGSGASLAGLRRWRDLKECIVGTVVTPYVGVVDRGNATDPVSGTSTFQSNALIGLGSQNNGDVQIVYGETLRSNFGINASFSFNSATGTINLDFNGSGEEFFTGASLWIDRNQ